MVYESRGHSKLYIRRIDGTGPGSVESRYNARITSCVTAYGAAKNAQLRHKLSITARVDNDGTRKRGSEFEPMGWRVYFICKRTRRAAAGICHRRCLISTVQHVRGMSCRCVTGTYGGRLGDSTKVGSPRTLFAGKHDDFDGRRAAVGRRVGNYERVAAVRCGKRHGACT